MARGIATNCLDHTAHGGFGVKSDWYQDEGGYLSVTVVAPGGVSPVAYADFYPAPLKDPARPEEEEKPPEAWTPGLFYYGNYVLEPNPNITPTGCELIGEVGTWRLYTRQNQIPYRFYRNCHPTSAGVYMLGYMDDVGWVSCAEGGVPVEVDHPGVNGLWQPGGKERKFVALDDKFQTIEWNNNGGIGTDGEYVVENPWFDVLFGRHGYYDSDGQFKSEENPVFSLEKQLCIYDLEGDGWLTLSDPRGVICESTYTSWNYPSPPPPDHLSPFEKAIYKMVMAFYAGSCTTRARTCPFADRDAGYFVDGHLCDTLVGEWEGHEYSAGFGSTFTSSQCSVKVIDPGMPSMWCDGSGMFNAWTKGWVYKYAISEVSYRRHYSEEWQASSSHNASYDCSPGTHVPEIMSNFSMSSSVEYGPWECLDESVPGGMAESEPDWYNNATKRKTVKNYPAHMSPVTVDLCMLIGNFTDDTVLGLYDGELTDISSLFSGKSVGLFVALRPYASESISLPARGVA
jgi:hypothetical protein